MTVVDLYTIQIVRDPALPVSQWRNVLFMAAAIAETEENLSDLLPHGYMARIRPWDQLDDPDEGNDDE